MRLAFSVFLARIPMTGKVQCTAQQTNSSLLFLLSCVNEPDGVRSFLFNSTDNNELIPFYDLIKINSLINNSNNKKVNKHSASI